MNDKDNGGSAFPFLELDSRGFPYHQNEGVSVRDYFAAKAMHGIMQMIASGSHKVSASYPEADIANQAYQLADAMLKARNQ